MSAKQEGIGDSSRPEIVGIGKETPKGANKRTLTSLVTLSGGNSGQAASKARGEEKGTIVQTKKKEKTKPTMNKKPSSLALLYLLTVIVDIGDIKAGRVKLFCDNQSALDNVFGSTPKCGAYPMLAVDYDLLVLSRDLLRLLPITITGEWVKGHYKGDNRQIQHDLNDLVDTLANEFRQDPARGYKPTSKPMFHPLQAAAVYIEGSMITSKLSNVLYERRFQQQQIQRIQRRMKWTTAEFELIDWMMFGKVFHSYSRFYQTSIAKLVHGL